jgi:hypothetical protein
LAGVCPVEHLVTHRLDIGVRDRRSQGPSEGPAPLGGVETRG